MEAKELRIGNIIKQGEIKSFYEHGVHVGMGKTYKFSELEPVELNVPIFEDLGFSIFYSAFEHDNIVISRIVNPERYLYQRTEIKYVHQLQNLYYALCGEELNTK